MKSNFHERRQARIERFNDMAEENERKSEELRNESRKMASVIPFGQPVLVGHYSEGRDRRYRDRIWNKMGKAVEAGRKAEYYAEKAAAANGNNAIFSDDPAAVTKLKEKIARLEKDQETMKKVNRICRAKKKTAEQKTEELKKIGYSLGTIQALLNPQYSYEKPGFQGYRLTNNNANIRRLKDRLEQIERLNAKPTGEICIDGVKIIDNAADNRVQVFFTEKPSAEIRAQLKRNGFKWSRLIGAWQRHRSTSALWAAKDIIKDAANS